MNISKILIPSFLLLAASTQAQSTADLNKLSADEAAQGFQLLFDGTLKSFQDNFQDHKQEDVPSTTGSLSSQWVVDNTLKAIMLTANTTDIRSKKMYRNFDWRFDYRCDNNEGVFYRFLTRSDKPYETGVEFAIDNNTDLSKTSPGAVYDVFPPSKNTYFLWDNSNVAGNKWNSLRIVAINDTVKGDSVEHWLNGTKVAAFTYHNQRWWDAYNNSKWNSGSSMSVLKAGDRSSGDIKEGFIGLQANHDGKWQIRNFRINTTADLAFGPPRTGVSTLKPANQSKLGIHSTNFSKGTLSFSFNAQEKIKSAALFTLGGKLSANLSISKDGQTGYTAQAGTPGTYIIVYKTLSSSFSQKVVLD